MHLKSIEGPMPLNMQEWSSGCDALLLCLRSRVRSLGGELEILQSTHQQDPSCMLFG